MPAQKPVRIGFLHDQRFRWFYPDDAKLIGEWEDWEWPPKEESLYLLADGTWVLWRYVDYQEGEEESKRLTDDEVLSWWHERQRRDRVLPEPIRTLMEPRRVTPAAPPADQERVEPYRRALVLIAEHPDWTVKEYFRELGMSKSAFYRMKAEHRQVEAALKGRMGQPPPHGFKDKDGNMDSWEDKA
jgi:hypothetical protein